MMYFKQENDFSHLIILDGLETVTGKHTGKIYSEVQQDILLRKV